jgi:hypothetical protein
MTSVPLTFVVTFMKQKMPMPLDLQAYIAIKIIAKGG